MTPRRLLGLSAVLLTTLFVALLVVQGRRLGDEQLLGMVFAAVMSLTLTVLVFAARTFPGAARAYIAALSVAVVGSAAAALVRAQPGDVLGLIGSVTAALVCASQCVAKLRAQVEDDAVISPRSVAALQQLATRIRCDVSETLAALSSATAKSEPYLIERLAQLRVEAAQVDAWSRRMRLPTDHPARKTVTSVRRRLSA